MKIQIVSKSALSETERLRCLMEKKRHLLQMDNLPGLIFAPADQEDSIGYYEPEQNLIVLSDHFLKDQDKSDEEATLLHELAHAEDFFMRGMSQHDVAFRAICASLGVPEGFEKARIKLNREKKEKNKDKVEKLIRLSESPFENESTSALKKAQELMAEYGIKSDEDDEASLYRAEIRWKKKYYYYEKTFFSVLKRLSGAFILREKIYGYTVYVAYGTVEQVEFVYDTFFFLENALIDAYNAEVMKNDDYLDFYSFASGLSARLYEKVVAESLDNVSRALIISHDENRRKFQEIFTQIRIVQNKSRSVYQDQESFEKGKSAAGNIRIPQNKDKNRVKKLEYDG